MRKRLISMFIFVGGLYFFLAFFIPAKVSFVSDPNSIWHAMRFTKFHEQVTTGVSLVGSMAVGIGVINILLHHGKTLVRVRKGWINSAALIGAMFFTMAASFWTWHNATVKSAGNEASLSSLSRAIEGIYTSMIMGSRGLYASLSAAMFSMLAFFVASAAYRAFRIKSAEAAFLMLAALIVMLGQIPTGVATFDPALHALGIADGLSGVRLWIFSYVVTPAFRGIMQGVGIAGLAMATRMWLSMESGAFYSDQE